MNSQNAPASSLLPYLQCFDYKCGSPKLADKGPVGNGKICIVSGHQTSQLQPREGNYSHKTPSEATTENKIQFKKSCTVKKQRQNVWKNASAHQANSVPGQLSELCLCHLQTKGSWGACPNGWWLPSLNDPIKDLINDRQMPSKGRCELESSKGTCSTR